MGIKWLGASHVDSSGEGTFGQPSPKGLQHLMAYDIYGISNLGFRHPPRVWRLDPNELKVKHCATYHRCVRISHVSFA